MLYTVDDPKNGLKILTHTFNPLMQTNGFKQLGDFVAVDSIPTEDTQLGSWFSKKVVGTVKQAIKKPLPALATLSGKIALGGITLVTETGVLGKDAKRIGKKAEVVASSASSGAAAGFVTSGFNPAGLVAGAVAGGAKGFAEATKTSKPGDIGRSFYQAAAWGAAAGVATAASKAVIDAKAASAAKAANVAKFAGESGYVVPGANSAGYLATTAKIGKDVLLGTVLAKSLIPQAAQPPADGYQPGQDGDTNISIIPPGSGGGSSDGGYTPGGGGYTSGGGADATVPFADTAMAAVSSMSPATKVALVAGSAFLIYQISHRRRLRAA